MDAGKEFIWQGKNVTVKHDPSEENTLNDVSFEIGKGEWVALVGRSGSGKSTLTKVIAGIVPIVTGTVERGTKQEPFMQLVLQNPQVQIVGETVYEDVCYGLENYSFDSQYIHKRAELALNLVGLAGLKFASTDRLSGGQKQLLCVASAVAVEAPLIVFDETTSMLDPASRERVLRVVKHLYQEGIAILWITQLMDELAYADRVVVLERGELCYNNNPRHFFYGANRLEDEAPCERFGFEPPYVVKVAHHLQEAGLCLANLPLTAKQLASEVGSLDVDHCGSLNHSSD